jgi:hypothetical protein
VATKTNFPRVGGNTRVDSFYRFGIPAGNVLYVHSGTGTASGPGFSPETAYSTIDAAVGACTADNNDVIVVLPGHVETVTAAAGLALDVAGVTVLGTGSGRQRGRINYTTNAAASVDVTAARVTIDNLVFTMIGVDAVTAGINVSGADFVLQNCEIEFADGTNQATLALLTAATASRMIVRNNYFHGSANAGTAAAIRHAAGDDVQIVDNVIVGNFTTSLGGIDNTAAVANLQVHRNVITNGTASSTKAMVWHASTTGCFSNNRMGILSGTAPVTAAAGTNGGGGYYSAAAGVTAATLI